MLRLPPTAISLTITEVKEFERRRRFKNYLAREDVFGSLPIRPRVQSATQNNQGAERRQPEQIQHAVIPKPPKEKEHTGGLKALACLPHRPASAGGSNTNVNLDELSSSQSQGSTSPNRLGSVDNTGVPMALPPPFSLGSRVVLDVQSLPTSRRSGQATPGREAARQEPPITPPRQSSLRDTAQSSPTSTPLSSGTGSRIFSSAARFVESIVRFPRHSSPSPSPLNANTDSASQLGRDGASSPRVDTAKIRVYNDSFPASLQSQTPMNLPEVRHQGRLRGAYTAPTRRTATRESGQLTDAARSGHRDDDDRVSLAAPGFQGLYGGPENTDDTGLYQHLSPSHDESSSGQTST